MAKKIKVYLQYPWKFPDSPYYKYLIDNPPKNIEFLNTRKQKGAITSAKKFARLNQLKRFVRVMLGAIKIPNLVHTKKKDFDLLHCAHCLSLNKGPWIVDVEKYWNFSATYSIAHSKRIKKMLKLPNCKKIIPWTEAAKKSITNALRDKEIEKKIEVIYPAIPAPKLKRKKKKGVTLLFVGRYFNSKGGLQSLKIMDLLIKKYSNVNAIFVSSTPKKIIKKYVKNKRIKFYDLMPQNQLYEIFAKSDLFIYPGFSDSFGFANLEAMSFGLVTLGVNRFAREEIIKDGETGFIIKIPPITYKGGAPPNVQDGIPIIPNEKRMIEDFVNKASLLIENERLRKSMGKASRKEIEKGKFSIKQRNKKLERVYKEALK